MLGHFSADLLQTRCSLTVYEFAAGQNFRMSLCAVNAGCSLDPGRMTIRVKQVSRRSAASTMYVTLIILQRRVLDSRRVLRIPRQVFD